MKPCDYCKEPVEPTKENQRFCTTPGKNCRSKWHRENRCPGKVTGLRALKHGVWSVTVHYTKQPNGIIIGTMVRLETDDMPRSDANTGENTG
jgi:hypothetical protein